ncbi:MAG: outer membrane beta-barrel protein [Chitinophagales bacterium]
MISENGNAAIKVFGGLLYIIFLMAAPVSSQIKFSAGSIALINGDTLSGFLNDIPGRKSPRSVQFSSSASGTNARTYVVNQVKWFRYKQGDWYFHFTGSIESSSLNQSELLNDSVMHTIIDTLFIRAVILGKASLYYARDRNDRIHLFIQKDGRAISELAYKKYYVDQVVVADYRNQITRKAIMANELYKGQLINAFADCRHLASGILSRPLQYNKNDLLKLFEEYNRCKDARIIYKELKEEGKVNLTLAGGINVTGAKITSSQITQWQGINFEHNIGYQLGVGINWILPRQKQWSLYNEISARHFDLKGENASINSNYTLDVTYAKVATMLRYQFVKDNIQPYFGLGMMNNFILTFDGKQLPDPGGATIVSAYRSYEQGLAIGAGINFHHLNAEFRLERSNGWSVYSDLSTTLTTEYFLIGYSF